MTRPAIVNARATPRSAIFGSSAGSNGQVLSSGSNGETFWSPFVRSITADGSNVLLRPDVNLASGSNIVFTFDAPPIGGGSLPSNTLRIHSTGGGGGVTLSYGSNATRVSEDSAAGVNTNVSRSDHRHDGIGTITASSSNTMQRGTWNLRAGTGIALALTDTDGDGEFDTTTIVNTVSAGGGGGAGASGALVLVEQHTASSSASLNFTLITSTYDEYLFECINLLPASSSVDFYVRMSTDGGSTYDSGANYGDSIFAWSHAGTANTGTKTGGNQIRARNNGEMRTTSTGGLNGDLRLFNPASTAMHKATLAHWWFMNTSDELVATEVRGRYISTTAVNAITFFFSSGNIASGTIRMYGIAKT